MYLYCHCAYLLLVKTNMKFVILLWIHSTVVFFCFVSTYGQNDKLKTIQAVASDSVNLKCQKGGERTIFWNNNGQPLYINGAYHGSDPERFALDGKYADNHNLMITNLKLTDTGRYECLGITSGRLLAGYNLIVIASSQRLEQLSTTSEQGMYSTQETYDRSLFNTSSMTNTEQTITTSQMDAETTPEPTSEPDDADATPETTAEPDNNGGSNTRKKEPVTLCIVILMLSVIL